MHLMASRRGPDNSVRVSISGTVNGVNWANVFYCQLTTSGSISQTDLDAWLNSFQAAYKTRLAPIQNAAVQYSLAKAVLFTPGGGELLAQMAMTGTGTQSGTFTADQSACKVLSWLTSVYWRGGKPRTYSPGMNQADTSDNHQLTAAAITAATTAASNLRTDVNALTASSVTGTSFGFVSFQSGNAERATPVFFAFSGVRVHPRFGTQRRRLGRWVA